MAEDTLFGPAETPVRISADRKRTLRNTSALTAGKHPVTGLRLSWVDGQTCGNCDHHFSHTRNKTWHKCDLNATRGAGTDIRLSWPACTAWAAEPDS
ncbi:MAG: hypothetical protein KA758_07505 [Acidimicrobiales bacterium]|nr:hypothetical protein [Acidimicrobiales bacterium]